MPLHTDRVHNRSIACVVAWLLLPSLGHADHFSIDLEAKAGKSTQKAKTETAALGTKAKARAALEVRPGKTIRVTWTVASTAKKDTAKDVWIHFFVVKIDKAGQTTVPKLDKDVPVETNLIMDFKPKDKTDGTLEFQIDQPGTYLLRVETLYSTEGVDAHEHFAALDLLVK